MKFFAYITLCIFTLSLSSCYNEKTTPAEKSDVEFESDVTVGKEDRELRIGEGTIFEVVEDNESLKLLRYALRSTGLDSALADEGPYTLFAPSDKAFDELSETRPNAIPDSIGNEELKNILLHHVVRGSFSDAEIVNLEQLEPLYGNPIKVTKEDGKIRVGGASMIFKDRVADNGYVHIIDEVIFPE
ncbi:MAG: fasciclin domain-containing protein [Cyclobacteriaceae bacterium]